MALSLMTIAHLQSVAERDAKLFVQGALDLRRRNALNKATYEALRKRIQTKTLMDEVTDGLTKPGDINEVCAYYVAEFPRRVETLWSVLMAASGTAETSQETPHV